MDKIAIGMAKKAVSIAPSHKFTSVTERNAYFLNTPNELKKGMYCFNNGQLQQYDNGVWVDTTPAIKGADGKSGVQSDCLVKITVVTQLEYDALTQTSNDNILYMIRG